MVAQMLQMVSFVLILDNFGPKAAQMLQIINFGIMLDSFGPKAPQMARMGSFGTILNHFLSDDLLYQCFHFGVGFLS